MLNHMQPIKICVIGLGYVGLPLARLFSTKYEPIGFDMNQPRVDALNEVHAETLEVSDALSQEALKTASDARRNWTIFGITTFTL